MEQSLYIGLSDKEGATRYGAGYTELVNRRISAGPDPFASENSERRFYLRSQSLPLTGGSRIRPLSYVSRQYDAEGNHTNGFELRYNSERIATLPQPHQFVAATFAKHGLNPKQAYLQEELDVLAEDLMRIPLPDGRIILADQVILRFDEAEGYIIHDIGSFALLIPDGFKEPPAASQPAADDTDAEVADADVQAAASAAAAAATTETAASAAEAASVGVDAQKTQK